MIHWKRLPLHSPLTFQRIQYTERSCYIYNIQDVSKNFYPKSITYISSPTIDTHFACGGRHEDLEPAKRSSLEAIGWRRASKLDKAAIGPFTPPLFVVDYACLRVAQPSLECGRRTCCSLIIEETDRWFISLFTLYCVVCIVLHVMSVNNCYWYRLKLGGRLSYFYKLFIKRSQFLCFILFVYGVFRSDFKAQIFRYKSYGLSTKLTFT